VMTRRYYWIRNLHDVQVTERSGRPLVTAEYTHDGHEYLIVATVADGEESAAATDLPQLIQAIPAGRTVLVDLYVTSQTPEENGSGAPDARADRIRGDLADFRLGQREAQAAGPALPHSNGLPRREPGPTPGPAEGAAGPEAGPA